MLDTNEVTTIFTGAALKPKLAIMEDPRRILARATGRWFVGMNDADCKPWLVAELGRGVMITLNEGEGDAKIKNHLMDGKITAEGYRDYQIEKATHDLQGIERKIAETRELLKSAIEEKQEKLLEKLNHLTVLRVYVKWIMDVGLKRMSELFEENGGALLKSFENKHNQWIQENSVKVTKWLKDNPGKELIEFDLGDCNEGTNEKVRQCYEQTWPSDGTKYPEDIQFNVFIMDEYIKVLSE